MTTTSQPAKRDQPLRVGVDLDGVLYPFVDSLRQHISAATGQDPQHFPEPTQWDFSSQWGMSSQQLLAWIHDGIDTGTVLLDQDPYPGAVAALQLLHQAGHHIHLVTDRAWLGTTPGRAEQRTRQWLHDVGMPFDELTFAKDKTSVPTDVFIDDRPENFFALRAAGVRTYLRDHPHNAHLQVEHPFRVPEVGAFAQEVLRLTA